MSQLSIQGMASGKLIATIDITQVSTDQTVFSILRSHGIPLASSCMGEGICHKCVINDGEISCLLTLEAFLQQFPDAIVKIDYL